MLPFSKVCHYCRNPQATLLSSYSSKSVCYSTLKQYLMTKTPLGNSEKVVCSMSSSPYFVHINRWTRHELGQVLNPMAFRLRTDTTQPVAPAYHRRDDLKGLPLFTSDGATSFAQSYPPQPSHTRALQTQADHQAELKDISSRHFVMQLTSLCPRWAKEKTS